MDFTTIIIIAIVALAFILALYVFIRSQKPKFSSQQISFIKSTWQKIISETNSNPNNAILDADKLLGHVLKLKGIEGSVGEQLKKSSALLSDINSVWNAHKVRNQIAHEIGMKVDPVKAKSVLNIYQKAFKDLGI